MDVSIVAAVGSFIVSERVIKAKATILCGLLGMVIYDLFIHSNDPVSLRVYRGELRREEEEYERWWRICMYVERKERT